MAKALTLIDLEDFLPLLQDEEEDNSIESDTFIENQYQRFIEITSNTAINHIEHGKLQRFKGFVLKHSAGYKKNKVRRNYLFNLIYNKYMFDIQSIRSQNVFNNFYFSKHENGIIKQFFVAAVQVLFTILLLIEIIVNFDDIDFDNNLKVILGLIVVYLSVVLIKPSISSIVHDLRILREYFYLAPLNTILNVTANIIVALILPWLTFYVILYAETLTDIVLNATAIAFIIELDDVAAGAVDLQNWFVSSTTSFEAIFCQIIDFNDGIITNDASRNEHIVHKIKAIKKALKDSNTNLEYSETEICRKILHMLRNIAGFILTPLLIYQHPFRIIADVCQCRKEKKKKRESTHDHDDDDDDDDDKETIHSHYKPLKIQHQLKQLISTHSVETEKEEEEENDSARLARNNRIAKALQINAKGNRALYEHRFNEAHRQYTEGIELLLNEYMEDAKYDEDTVYKNMKNNKELQTLSILNFNNGFALYQRAKQSWISEIITNVSGHPFTNYKEAIESLKRYALCDDDRKDPLYNKLLSDIHYDLYEFSESEKYYKKFQKDCKHKSSDKSLLRIRQQKDAFGGSMGYLEILNNARKHMFVDKENKCNHFEDKDCALIKLDDILKHQEKHPLFTENKRLIAKYYWFRSECYAKDKEREQLYVADLRKATETSTLYGWALFRYYQNPPKELCDEIITTYTNHIEFEPQQPYYYYIRGVVYYELRRYQDAANDFKKAIKLNENDPVFHIKLIDCKKEPNGHLDISESEKYVSKLRGSLIGLIRTNTKLGIVAAYIDVSLKDDDEGMKQEEYQSFLNELNKLNKKTHHEFESYGTFDDLCDDNRLIPSAKMDDLIDKLTETQFEFRIIEHLQRRRDQEKHLDEVQSLLNRLEKVTNSKVKNAKKLSRDILMRIKKDENGLTKKQWANFVDMLPKYLVQLYDVNNDNNNQHDSYNQLVLQQHDITFEKYEENGIMDMDQFLKIVDKLCDIIESKLQNLYIIDF